MDNDPNARRAVCLEGTRDEVAKAQAVINELSAAHVKDVLEKIASNERERLAAANIVAELRGADPAKQPGIADRVIRWISNSKTKSGKPAVEEAKIAKATEYMQRAVDVYRFTYKKCYQDDHVRAIVMLNQSDLDTLKIRCAIMPMKFIHDYDHERQKHFVTIRYTGNGKSNLADQRRILRALYDDRLVAARYGYFASYTCLRVYLHDEVTSEKLKLIAQHFGSKNKYRIFPDVELPRALMHSGLKRTTVDLQRVPVNQWHTGCLTQPVKQVRAVQVDRALSFDEARQLAAKMSATLVGYGEGNKHQDMPKSYMFEWAHDADVSQFEATRVPIEEGGDMEGGEEDEDWELRGLTYRLDARNLYVVVRPAVRRV